MKMYAYIQDDMIVRTGDLPSSWKNTSGFNLLPVDRQEEAGWFEVPPNESTQYQTSDLVVVDGRPVWQYEDVPAN